MDTRPRVLLDANLWSYVGRQDLGSELVSLEDRLGIVLMLQPAALMECLNTRDPELRQRIVDAMTTIRRPTLRTEAAEEAGELVGEVQRLRPQWLRQFPTRGRIARLDKFWTRTSGKQPDEMPPNSARHVHPRSTEMKGLRITSIEFSATIRRWPATKA